MSFQFALILISSNPKMCWWPRTQGNQQHDKKRMCSDQSSRKFVFLTGQLVWWVFNILPDQIKIYQTRLFLCETRHVLVKHRCHRPQQSQTMANISKSYILTPPHPKGHVMSVKCEQPLDELTVQVWLQYDHPNFKYCTLFISGTELRTDKRTDGRTIQH